MRALILLASVGMVAATALAQQPPPPPVIIGAEPIPSPRNEKTVVTGIVSATADGNVVIRSKEHEYQVVGEQQSRLLPYVDEWVKAFGHEVTIGERLSLLVVESFTVQRR